MSEFSVSTPTADIVGATAGQASAAGRLVASRVPDNRRMSFLPKHFGRDMLLPEVTVYNAMRTICPSYRGGFWEFMEVSNGAFYMRPGTDEPLAIDLRSSNGYSGQMTADAAGITATLFALNQLVWDGREQLNDAFYQLRAFAAQHPEFREIFGAID